MFSNFLQLISRRMPPDYERGFVEEVRIRHVRRNRRIERLFVICWIVIAVKCAVVVWACRHYHIPFNPLWVIVPTIVFAALATAIYFWRD